MEGDGKFCSFQRGHFPVGLWCPWKMTLVQVERIVGTK